MKISLPLDEAQWLAGELLVKMQPYCERIAVAGSIRREKEIVGDIEIVCLTKRKWNTTLFGERTSLQRNDLFEAQDWQTSVQWIRPAIDVVLPWHIRPDGKYWRGLIEKKIPLDIFLVEADNWGIQYLIRTGSADFSKRVVTALRYQKNLPVYDGFVHDAAGQIVPTPTEESVFDLLGWKFIEPKERNL